MAARLSGMRSTFSTLITAAALAVVSAPAAASAQDFHWRGSIAQGRAIEIKGVNGDVLAEASGSNDVEVVAEKRARRDARQRERQYHAQARLG